MYDEAFYVEEGRVARQAAEIVLPWIFAKHPHINDVIDVGCGTGEWVWVAEQHGKGAVGFDAHVPFELQVATVYKLDFVNESLDAWADLAICLEVVEHLPDTVGRALVEELADSRYVLFSAATPGQPGVGHINCQPHEYWHDQFAQYGMTPTHIGPQFPTIADFYQRNLYIYTREET